MLETADDDDKQEVDVKEQSDLNGEQAKFSNNSNDGRLNYGIFCGQSSEKYDDTSIKSKGSPSSYKNKLKCKKEE